MARDGCSLADIQDKSCRLLGKRLVQPGVHRLVKTVTVTASLAHSGPTIISVHDPVCTDEGDLQLALHGSFLPLPSADLFAAAKQTDSVVASKANLDEYVLVDSEELYVLSDISETHSVCVFVCLTFLSFSFYSKFVPWQD